MRKRTTLYPKITVGLDLGDRKSVTCEIQADGTISRRGEVATTRDGIGAYFANRPSCRVVMETGTHSPWIARQLEGLGHEAVVGNAAKMYRGQLRRKRNDRSDAEFLARQGRADVTLLHPIKHRSPDAQADLEMIRARDQLVATRTKLINHVRGAVKSLGGRLGRCSAEAFSGRVGPQIPEALRPALQPILDVVVELTKRIHQCDQELDRIITADYPQAQRLRQIKGVGPLTALAFVLLIEDAKRFERSRDVGAYFGLVPRLDESSDSKPQLRISKAGDELGRRLLVSAAQYILGPFGPECDLRRHGEAIAQRGGKNAKKRAAVAVARKLAVLMHRMWVSDLTYDPDRLLKRRAA
jgi:transposase